MDWRAYLRHLDYLLLGDAPGSIAYGVDDDLLRDAQRRRRRSRCTTCASSSSPSCVGLVAAGRRLAARLRALPPLPVAAVRVRGRSSSSPCCRWARTSTARARWIDLGFTSFQPSAAGAAAARRSASARSSPTGWSCWGRKRVTLMALACVARAGAPRLPGAGLRLGHGASSCSRWPCSTSTARRGRTSRCSPAAGVGAFVVALKVLPLAGIHLIQQYQMDRLFVFLNPAHDPSGQPATTSSSR